MAYDKESIRILEKLEPIRVRPDMFIGDTDNPNHLMYEIIDNSVDELINGFGNKMGIYIDTINNEYTVIDDGRGIPLDQIDNEDIPILLATIPFSGGKFNKTAYRISAGLHGVGMSAVNALSDNFEIEVYRVQKNMYGNKLAHLKYKFEDGLLVDKKVEKLPRKYNKPYSTRISFKPSKTYFETLLLDADKIKKRLEICSIFTGKEILFNVDGNQEIIKENLYTHFKNSYINDPLFDPIVIEYKDGNQSINLVFAYEKNDEPCKTSASVNLIPVNLGFHISSVEQLFIDIMFSRKGNRNFIKRDCLVGLKIYFNIFLEETKFASQTKERLTTPKKKLIPIIGEQLKCLIEKTLDKKKLLQVLLDKFELYRTKLDSKTKVKQLSGNIGVRGIMDEKSKLRDCMQFKNSELVIIEGDSAGKTCLDARDKKIHAILPLKGKVMNISSNKKLEKILKNNELYDIIKTVGIGFKSKTTNTKIGNIRYSKIVLCPDPDPDGEHITVLLLNFFMIMLPDVIEQGMLYVADIPLYGLVTKTKFIPCWSREELEEQSILYPGANKRRFKGLGEFNSDQLGPCLFDKNIRKLYKVKPVSEPTKQELINLLVDSSYKRMLLSGEFDSLIERINREEIIDVC